MNLYFKIYISFEEKTNKIKKNNEIYIPYHVNFRISLGTHLKTGNSYCSKVDGVISSIRVFCHNCSYTVI